MHTTVTVKRNHKAVFKCRNRLPQRTLLFQRCQKWDSGNLRNNHLVQPCTSSIWKPCLWWHCKTSRAQSDASQDALCFELQQYLQISSPSTAASNTEKWQNHRGRGQGCREGVAQGWFLILQSMPKRVLMCVEWHCLGGAKMCGHHPGLSPTALASCGGFSLWDYSKFGSSSLCQLFHHSEEIPSVALHMHREIKSTLFFWWTSTWRSFGVGCRPCPPTDKTGTLFLGCTGKSRFRHQTQCGQGTVESFSHCPNFGYSGPVSSFC